VRPLIDSNYIFGIHDPGGEEHMLAADKPGWVLFSEAIGHDPNDMSGVDFRYFAAQGLGVMCRINNGFVPNGTIPHSSMYEAFARRVSNFVATSRGCKTWIIGNEMNYAVERPDIQIDWARHARSQGNYPEDSDPLRRGLPVRFNILPDFSDEIRTTRGAIVSPGETITPALYARCYRLCADAIHRTPGHENDLVLVGAVAPWNTQSTYPGNPNGDWIQYFREILEILGPMHCDGFTLHTYTHGADPALIESDAMLPPPFQLYHRQFRAYTDFMYAVPRNMQHLPAFITETDQAGYWLDQNGGWVQRAYAEIDRWNNEPNNQQIRSLCLFRWPRFDKYHIDGKLNVIEDFTQALTHDYRWKGSELSGIEDELMPPRMDPDSLVRGAQLGQPGGYQPGVQQSAIIPPGTTQPAQPMVDAERIVPPIQAQQPTFVPPDPQYRPDPQPGSSQPPLQPPTPIGQQPSEQIAAQSASLAAIPPPLSANAPPYRIEWDTMTLPSRMMVGAVIEVQITLKNSGSLVWSMADTHPFRLGYHYYRNTSQLTIPTDRALRTELPQDVAPGQSITQTMRIALPQEPGNYTLEIDLSHEGITWFKEQGSTPLTRWITVEAPEVRRESNGSGLDATGSGLPVPLFDDISLLLPRSGVPYAHRDPNQIRYLIVSHTGADPEISLDLIARAHIRSGYPGIAYQFVVDRLGQVYKVSGLEEVAQPRHEWSTHGVNICLTGDFSTDAPPLTQLDAASRLCAWLTQNLNIDDSSLFGLGELTDSMNPGATFYDGPMWKETLRRQIRLNLAVLSGGNDTQRLGEMDSLADELKSKNETLQASQSELQGEREKMRLLNEQLQAEVKQLHGQLEMRGAEVEPGLRIQDTITDLPREAERYVDRPAENVRHIVINHTGASPRIPHVEIAKVHMVEWPGILYDFIIDEDGIIHQTQPLDKVVDTDQHYLSQAINVAFAGEFHEQVPTDAQLYSGGQLITWLLDHFPNVSLREIKGISEFIEHTSPGAQWLKGSSWKDMLMASVRRESGIYDPSEVENELRDQLATSTAALVSAEQMAQELEAELDDLRAQKKALQAEVTTLSDETLISYTVPEPATHDVVDTLPRHPTLQYETRALDQITHVAIHHTATPPTVSPQRIADLHVNADPSRGKEAWPGIGYHYFVYEDGSIDQTNRLATVGHHVYKHSGYSVGVVFAGSFMNGRIPTTAQIRSGAHLVAWLMQERHIPLARVMGHTEFPDNKTVCPGSEWTQGNHWRDMLFERVEEIQRGIGLKNIRHCLLLSNRQRLLNAMAYVEQFRPTVVFSVSDAKNAEYVTIVGPISTDGFSAEDEADLVRAGCKVERVAGSDDVNTGRILGELAQAGRRFREFEVEF